MNMTNENEKAFYGIKWFDYRMLSIDTATVAFLNEFAKCQTSFNEDTGKTRYFSFFKNMSGFEPTYMKKYKTDFWNSLVKLRQWADGHFMSYDDYWRWAFRAFNDLSFNKCYLNAFINTRLKMAVLDYKDENTTNFLKKSDLPYFKADNFTGNKIQCDYYDYLIRQIKARYPMEYDGMFAKYISEGTINQEYLKTSLKRLDITLSK